MEVEKLRNMIIQHEGRRHQWYKDTLGNWTIGVGHLATKHDDLMKDWTDEQIDQQLSTDMLHALAMVQQHLPWFNTLNYVRQSALIDMCFNMGWGKLAGFHNMLACGEKGNFDGMAKEAINSLWAKQVGLSRSLEIARMLKRGEWPDE